MQFTRSKSLTITVKAKDLPPKDMVTTRQSKEIAPPAKIVPKPIKKEKVLVKEEEVVTNCNFIHLYIHFKTVQLQVVVPDKDKKPKPKKKADSDNKSSDSFIEPLQTANLGDKLIVYYGPTNESKVTYEAKVVDMDKDQTGPIYLVHYTGWNTR